MDERVDRPEPQIAPGPLSRETRVTGRSRLRGLIIWIIVLAGLGGIGWYLWTKHASQGAARGGPGRAAQTPPQPVGAATIDKGDIRVMLNELGTVTSLDTVTVLTQISGQLTEVGFKEGQEVKKGDFLAQIDPRPFQAALEQAQGVLAHDQGLLDQAQSDLKRFLTLGRQDSIAQQQLDDQRFLVAQLTGTVQTDHGLVDNAKLNLAYCHIISPIDGQVGLRLVDQGNYIQVSGTTGIVVLTQMEPISVLFSVPEDNLPEIIQRVRSGVTLSVEAYDRANTRLLATGQLGVLDNQIDTTTGTLKLRALFANPDELLYPNQFVNARLLVNTMQNTIRVPVPAVQRGEPGTYVYVINANNTVSVRPVKVGPTDGGFMAVTSGLQVGEKVVTDGTDRLRDGAPVIVPAPAPPPGTQGAAQGGGQGKAADGSPGGSQGGSPGGNQGQGGPSGQGHGHQAGQSGEPASTPPAPANPAVTAPAGQPASQSGQQPSPQAR
jgi:multidrug efflux system membrane fusion protein